MPMSTPSLLPVGQLLYDADLLRALRGRRLSEELKVLCVIGAHRFDELPLINRLFPSLRHIYVFEPQPGPVAVLQHLAEQDSRLKVFPVAVSDADGVATFNVSSNDGESSSLLQLGSHRELFPHVTMQTTLQVPTRRLDSVLAEHGLESPDVMIIDVQGAEYLVLQSLPPSVLDRVRLIYAEVSTEAVYESSRPMSEVEALLAKRFVNIGFAAINANVPVHGNAVFVARADAQSAVAWTLRESLRQAFHRFKRRVRRRPPVGVTL
ncbi:MAG: FkbM family methyltransferase [Rhizobacter sp.]